MPIWKKKKVCIVLKHHWIDFLKKGQEHSIVVKSGVSSMVWKRNSSGKHNFKDTTTMVKHTATEYMK